MVVSSQESVKAVLNCTTIERIVWNTLIQAKLENRVILGLSNAVKILSKTPTESIFCFLAPPNKGDSATHMLETLLEAYCFEHDIYIIKVNCAEKLSKIMGSPITKSCALIQRSKSVVIGDTASTTVGLSKYEIELVDYCERYWEDPNQPIIELPES